MTRRVFSVVLFRCCAALAPPTVGPIEMALSGLASIVRTPFAPGAGSTALPAAAMGAALPGGLTLYEFEACPFCRRVREAVTRLDLVVDVVPCGRDSRHRAAVRRIGGKEQFPMLVTADGAALYESEAIVQYLYGSAGAEYTPPASPPADLASGLTATLLRFGRGAKVSAAKATAPAKPLQLYNYEANQFCRLVREVLCELDLLYTVISCGKGSPRRAVLAEVAGATACPYLVDPNTGAALGDSQAIVAYLAKTYGNFPASPSDVAKLKVELLALVADANYGVKKFGPEDALKFEGLVSALEACGTAALKAGAAPVRDLLTGRWELLWTTETELLFAIEKGLVGAGPCDGVFQDINVAAGTLDNVVDFANDSQLLVTSSLDADAGNPRRFDFAFKGCALRWRGFTVPLPPVGKGWGELAFIDGDLRIQRDVRGDLLIARRVNVPKRRV
ncbi:hypothetical protein M885DRAFT_553306 [Pelagophyceae sp. CCMP2097]|nr:hypothetical protein M885DRAFT_553306 [Pelagophyceae sp. CCMP2097]